MSARAAASLPAPSEIAARRAAFRDLHRAGCFVIPNPWDIGSARWLQTLGFKALATTSAGFAYSRGLPDSSNALDRDDVLRHIREMTAAVEVPFNADFQSGYAKSPREVAKNVKLCVETGVAGLSIEDSTGDSSHPLFELEEALDRLRAAREAIDATRSGVLLTARAECYLVGHSQPLAESIRRLTAYAEAGADVLFAPGAQTRDDISAIVAAAAPKPVNVIVFSSTGLTVADIAALGARRISVGSALARAAWTGFTKAADLIAKQGSFEGFASLLPYADLERRFGQGR